MKITNVFVLLICILFLQHCNDVDSEISTNYCFKLMALGYPPYNSILEGTLDTLWNGDSMILSIELISYNSLAKMTNSMSTNSMPVSPVIRENQTIITCSNNIIVESDTIWAGTNLYQHSVRDRISSEEKKIYTGAIYFSGKCQFIEGDNIFKLQVVDNFDKIHYDTCTVFIK